MNKHPKNWMSTHKFYHTTKNWEILFLRNKKISWFYLKKWRVIRKKKTSRISEFQIKNIYPLLECIESIQQIKK